MEQSRRITRRSASNLALGFVLLPKAKREAMQALYAFCRQVDDVADDDTLPVEQRGQMLQAWREDIQRACRGERPHEPVNQELQPVIARYGLRYELFDELLRGVEMDLEISRYPTYEALEAYCYRVASVVGLLSIEIFGYRNPRCRTYADRLGKALQLTNILRDVHRDAQRGRIYLPQEELVRHGVGEEEILQGHYSLRYRLAASRVARRARDFYRQARENLPPEDRRSMAAAELMGAVYWRLLRKLEAMDYDVFHPTPTRLSRPHKAAIVLGSWMRLMIGTVAPSYGHP